MHRETPTPKQTTEDKRYPKHCSVKKSSTYTEELSTNLQSAS
jgi:hypothetical protein